MVIVRSNGSTKSKDLGPGRCKVIGPEKRCWQPGWASSGKNNMRTVIAAVSIRFHDQKKIGGAMTDASARLA